MGKKKFVHSDLQQYELYMQFQEMKQLGEQMSAQNRSTLGDNSVDQNRAIGLKKSRQKNTFFGSVSKKMGEVFKGNRPKNLELQVTHNTQPYNPRTRFLTIPISGQITMMNNREYDGGYGTPVTLQYMSNHGLQETPYLYGTEETFSQKTFTN